MLREPQWKVKIKTMTDLWRVKRSKTPVFPRIEVLIKKAYQAVIDKDDDEADYLLRSAEYLCTSKQMFAAYCIYRGACWQYYEGLLSYTDLKNISKLSYNSPTLTSLMMQAHGAQYAGK